MTSDDHLIAINVGNSRAQVGRFIGERLVELESIPNHDRAKIVERVGRWWGEIAAGPEAFVALASVNPGVADPLLSALIDELPVEIHRVGEDLPVPIGRQLDPETIAGVDRLLNAAAAFRTLRQACVVVDAGTAITVDFVDGAGTFHGGAIAPGARTQLRSLHEATAALPEIDLRRPGAETPARNTAQAMLQGVYHGIRGMVWRLTERFAESYGAYPTVIATGGDAELLFGDDKLIDRIVPGLTLLGICATVRHAMQSDEADARR